MGSAREVALSCLLAGEKQGAWSDGALKNAIRQNGLSGRDAGLCTRLVYGVLQTQMLLDWHIDRRSSVPVEKMEPAVRGALRLGLYQLLFLDRVPVHAAVNESVALAKAKSRNPRAAGLVNAVLRAVERERSKGLPQPKELSIRYSHPEWLVKEFSHTLPANELEAALAADNAPVPTVAQVNTLKTSAADLAAELAASGVSVTPHPWLPDCLELAETGNIETLPAFREGKFYIQGAAARLAVLAAAPKAGMRVLDACAAPGGKSFAAAIAMEGKSEIYSNDIHPHKKALIEAGAARLGLANIKAGIMDARTFDPAQEEKFDLVIADVPCSGLGIIRKKPDIRYKAPEPLEGLPKVQMAILETVSRYVKPGGVLLYSTCTLLRRENEAVVNQFLAGHDDYGLEGFTLPGPIGKVEGMVTLWPHRCGTDGFFIAKLRKGE